LVDGKKKVEEKGKEKGLLSFVFYVESVFCDVEHNDRQEE
jgi:hypothetical protein